ncbi:MAG: hypothetical protein HQL65_12940 [Magnetococcales bacterium]|nr:hypothetical protein [Magnetococcales bacterium]
MKALKLYAIENINVHEGFIDNDIFKLSIACSSNNKLSDDELNEVLNKMRTHSLVSWDSSNQKWVIKQPQVEISLVSLFIIDAMAAKNRMPNLIIPENKINDISSMLVGMLDNEISKCRNIIEYLLNFNSNDLNKLAVLISIRCVEKNKLNRSEKANTLAELFKNGLSDLLFGGNISDFDMSGKRFLKCTFNNVRWNNCKFDSNTIFEKCVIKGGNANYCDGFGKIQFVDSEINRDANVYIVNSQIKEGKKSYSKDNLKDDVGILIRKFVPRGMSVFKSVENNNLTRGNISSSKYRDEILDELKRCVIESHQVSGVRDDVYRISNKAKDNVKFYLNNNVFVGVLQECIDNLVRKLDLK